MLQSFVSLNNAEFLYVRVWQHFSTLMAIELGNLYFEDYAFTEAMEHLWYHRIVTDLPLNLF